MYWSRLGRGDALVAFADREWVSLRSAQWLCCLQLISQSHVDWQRSRAVRVDIAIKGREQLQLRGQTMANGTAHSILCTKEKAPGRDLCVVHRKIWQSAAEWLFKKSPTSLRISSHAHHEIIQSGLVRPHIALDFLQSDLAGPEPGSRKPDRFQRTLALDVVGQFLQLRSLQQRKDPGNLRSVRGSGVQNLD